MTFLAKNDCFRNLKSRACNINRKWDLPEWSRTIGEIVNFARQTPLEIDRLAFSYNHFDSDCLVSMSGRLYSCAWLLLFEVLLEILSLCLVSCGIRSTTLNVVSVIVNYICLKCLFIPEIPFSNKSSIIKIIFHWLSTTRTPKIGTICCWGNEYMARLGISNVVVCNGNLKEVWNK